MTRVVVTVTGLMFLISSNDECGSDSDRDGGWGQESAYDSNGSWRQRSRGLAFSGVKITKAEFPECGSCEAGISVVVEQFGRTAGSWGRGTG